MRLNQCASCGHAPHPKKKCHLCPCRNHKGKVTTHPILPPPNEASYFIPSVGITTTEQLLDFHMDLCEAGRVIMNKKNRDYGSHEQHDPFANFRMFGELGILVRMSDKLSRLKNVIRRGEAAVSEETVEDTALDLLNYCVLLLAYRRNEKLKAQG